MEVPALRQPDDFSCGPTCLFKVLRGYGDRRAFEDVDRAVRRVEGGGTLGVFLGMAALELGYDATISSYNLRVCDPTWATLPPGALADKLAARAAVVKEAKLREAIDGYARFVRAGGRVRFDDLSTELLVGLLDEGHPIVCGLSATYLYQTPRVNPVTNGIDEIAGEPEGHFLVVCGYRQHGRHFIVSDPYRGLPMTVTGTYEVGATRLLNAILLGDVTYDGVLLVVAPRAQP
ncbi:MAG TPA: C39 family peptidase [Sandaracinaceae bacterium]